MNPEGQSLGFPLCSRPKKGLFADRPMALWLYKVRRLAPAGTLPSRRVLPW